MAGEIQNINTDILYDKHIMLVDDDEDNLLLMATYLLKHGARVATAIHGMGCLDFIEQCNDLNLLLIDLHMPLMGGLEAIERIREQSDYKSIPIVVLTDDDTVGIRDKCVNLGANDFLSKPITKDELIEAICVWISNAGYEG